MPADDRLICGEALLAQSTLTGESLPVEGAAGRITYAGALMRRGEALAAVIATLARTRYDRTAHGISTQLTTVLRVVRNLGVFNGAVVISQGAYAAMLGLPTREVSSVTLTAIRAAIPVALPATFALASALAGTIVFTFVLDALKAVIGAHLRNAVTARVTRGSGRSEPRQASVRTAGQARYRCNSRSRRDYPAGARPPPDPPRSPA